VRRAFVALALIGGCGSFDAAEPTPDGGADDASVADASSADASETDAGPFCATFVPEDGEPIFCRDFDDGRPAIEGWNQTNITSGASLELDTSAFKSAPAALFARLEADAGDGCAYARGIRDLGSLRVVTHVAFDVRLGGPASYFVFQTGTCAMIFDADAARGQVHVQTGGADYYYPMLDLFPRAGTWSHVEMVVRAATERFEVTIDGKPALSNGPQTLPAGCLTAMSKIILYVGLFCEPVSVSTREIRIDNVAVSGTKL
jgi:hypothetical protein